MNIGFIGLGSMGGPMARNLVVAGHSVTVHDLRRERADELLELGATWADSPRAAAERSEVTFTSLPGPLEMEPTALGPDGVLEGAGRGTVYVDLTSNSPAVVRRVHDAFREKGVAMLDAPVWGAVANARAGDLGVMVGGDEAVFELCKPLLDVIGDDVYHTGPIGCGCICKLVNNCVFACQQVAVMEGLTLGMKAGVKPRDLWRSVSRSALGEPQTGLLPSTLFKGEFEQRADAPVYFALRLSRKDMGLATELARQHDVPMSIAALCEQEHVTAMNRGWGDDNFTKVLALQEERAGVEFRIPDSEEDGTP